MDGVPKCRREHWDKDPRGAGTGTCWLLSWVCTDTLSRAAGGTGTGTTGTGTTAPGVPCPRQKSLWMSQETTSTDLQDLPVLLQLQPNHLKAQSSRTWLSWCCGSSSCSFMEHLEHQPHVRLKQSGCCFSQPYTELVATLGCLSASFPS